MHYLEQITHALLLEGAQAEQQQLAAALASAGSAKQSPLVFWSVLTGGTTAASASSAPAAASTSTIPTLLSPKAASAASATARGPLASLSKLWHDLGERWSGSRARLAALPSAAANADTMLAIIASVFFCFCIPSPLFSPVFLVQCLVVPLL